jgi:CO/xanthine dehydrogenase FAD-binding subunit
MIKGAFDYHTPASLEEAASALASVDGEVSVISGGTWVVPEMTHGVRRPRAVVDLRRAGLGTVRRDNGAVAIGTTVTYSGLLAAPDGPAVLKVMASGVTGGKQVHNQGTLGGSACYANPSSDVPAALVGVDATLRLVRDGGSREIAAADFFRGSFKTALEPGELLSEILVPAEPQGRFGYYKFKFSESSWPIATATCLVGSDGRVARLSLGGVSTTPVLVSAATGAGEAGDVAAAVAATEFEPWTDGLADGGYRRRIAGVIAGRAFAAATRDGEGS